MVTAYLNWYDKGGKPTCVYPSKDWQFNLFLHESNHNQWEYTVAHIWTSFLFLMTSTGEVELYENVWIIEVTNTNCSGDRQ